MDGEDRYEVREQSNGHAGASKTGEADEPDNLWEYGAEKFNTA